MRTLSQVTLRKVITSSTTIGWVCCLTIWTCDRLSQELKVTIKPNRQKQRTKKKIQWSTKETTYLSNILKSTKTTPENFEKNTIKGRCTESPYWRAPSLTNCARFPQLLGSNVPLGLGECSLRQRKSAWAAKRNQRNTQTKNQLAINYISVVVMFFRYVLVILVVFSLFGVKL